MDFRGRKNPVVFPLLLGCWAISHIFFQRGWWLETLSLSLFRGCTFFFSRGWSLSIPLYQWGGLVLWEGPGGHGGGMFSGRSFVQPGVGSCRRRIIPSPLEGQGGSKLHGQNCSPFIGNKKSLGKSR